MRTPFDLQNYTFSDHASRIAERTLYADLIRRSYRGILSWALIDTGFTEMDADQGIDRILTLRYPDHEEQITVQERFRRAEYAHFRELTATAANHMTGQTGDFFKLAADLYVYGYLADDLSWIEAVVVDARRLRAIYEEGIVIPSRAYYKRKKQVILGFPFDALESNGAVIWHSRLLNPS